MAGFLDGEGCILIVKDKTSLGNVTYRLKVYVGQINPKPLLRLQKCFRGLIQYRPSKNKNHRAVYTWEVHSKQAYDTIVAILPYLEVKKQEATVAAAFYEDVSANQRGKKRTEADLLTCETYKETLSTLKRAVFPREEYSLEKA